MLMSPAISFVRLDASSFAFGETIAMVKGFQTSVSETCVCLLERASDAGSEGESFRNGGIEGLSECC
jgi:hypothetical protein